ncbi:hypothetical protein FA15DRAFT_606540 [Coprinopsis marcescibilis]|uniref:CxC2-like cysteine cluster KDZ transposase-associated domain-containing protein n=1 Tax=Coprinopsis marcescibilis TaxID=230819 RepID=A0A5C3KAQ5_COPMA|nr:hypothetical protein FA15DRAFT_606540 [Coprinopsis marcescibilis]
MLLILLKQQKLWNGNFFEKSSLHAVGLVVKLGHDGRQCVVPSPPQTVQVFDITGVHKVLIEYCNCQSQSTLRFVQLLHCQLFPSTIKRIKTAYTFEMLNTFQELSLQGKTMIYDFYHTILNCSDPLHLEKCPVFYSSRLCSV